VVVLDVDLEFSDYDLETLDMNMLVSDYSLELLDVNLSFQRSVWSL
jgi:hypothetical protein